MCMAPKPHTFRIQKTEKEIHELRSHQIQNSTVITFALSEMVARASHITTLYLITWDLWEQHFARAHANIHTAMRKGSVNKQKLRFSAENDNYINGCRCCCDDEWGNAFAWIIFQFGIRIFAKPIQIVVCCQSVYTACKCENNCFENEMWYDFQFGICFHFKYNRNIMLTSRALFSSCKQESHCRARFYAYFMWKFQWNNINMHIL